MTARKRERDPLSPWLVGLAEIAAYADYGQRIVGAALNAGELEGRQRKPRARWRSKREWVDAWIDRQVATPHRSVPALDG